MNSKMRTVTFLFTDLENSTPLWDQHPDLMQALVARHNELIQEAIHSFRGRVVKNTGDGYFAVFDSASDGVAAAVAGQRAMIGESWPAETGPLRVRMGLHTGEGKVRHGDYFGTEVNRAARVMGLAYGGQVLLSEATTALIHNTLPPEITLSDLGKHRLKGLAAAEEIYQILHPALPSEFPELKSLSVYRHNLPVQVSSFVGRQKEIVHIKSLLTENHLLTLLGPGGTGKTRLMLEVAEEVIGDYADGVWLVELAPLADADLVPERVAATLNVEEQPGRAMQESLAAYLRDKQLLLLLDNVEHLVLASARLAQFLLAHCPNLKILVTGREALFIGGEITLQIPSLSLPGGNGVPTFEEIQASEGVQLFLTRAQDFQPEFELTPANAVTIADIVRRLDGIPLALELVTARLRMLTVEQIAKRLNDRFRLLTGGRRTALPRQQTLQAMIDWSWNLLEEKEQVLFRRLSVFSGGWSLEAAQAVASDDLLDEYEVFDNLEQLVNKSLVSVKYPVESEARYDFLESIHQYGQDRLIEANEVVALRDRHADYFVAFTEEVKPYLAQANILYWTTRISSELDNILAVLAWTLEERPDLALRICADLFYREAYSLSPREVRFWLESVIEKTRDQLNQEESKVRTDDFIRALLGLAVANGIQGHTDVAVKYTEEVIQLARSRGEDRYLAYAIAVKTLQHPFNLNPEEMCELEEAITICRKNGFVAELGVALVVYGTALDAQGEMEKAMTALQEAVEITENTNTRLDAGVFGVQARLARSLGNFETVKMNMRSILEDYETIKHRRGIVMGQSALAHVYRQEGNLDEAEAYYKLSIVGWQELGHRPAVAHQIECLAFIAIAREAPEHAAKLLGAAGRARKELNALSEDPEEIRDLAMAMEQLSKAMGEDARDKLLAEGALMNLDEAVRIALNHIQ